MLKSCYKEFISLTVQERTILVLRAKLQGIDSSCIYMRCLMCRSDFNLFNLHNIGDNGGGSLISPDGVAPSRIVGVSASGISACTIKSRRSFLLAPAHPSSPRKRAVKR